eukprot:10296502-Alexandrium_andersonii.AAC.1
MSASAGAATTLSGGGGMLGSEAKIASGGPSTNSSLGRSTCFPRTPRTMLNTSRTLWTSGDISRTTLRRRDSVSASVLANRARTRRSGSRN